MSRRVGLALWAALGVLGSAAAMSTPASDSSSTATALDRYLDGLNSLRTGFTQSVTDAHGNVVEAGAGTLIVQRPGKFRWDYAPKEQDAVATSAASAQRGQLLVADGKNLWFLDRELAQVSVKPVQAALSATPVMLLSGTQAQLRDSFDVSSADAHDGLDWVSVKPRSAEADFSVAQLGFAHGQLVRMVVNDRLGQTVQLDFVHSERNAHVDPQALQFKPPAGVDVIGTPQP